MKARMRAGVTCIGPPLTMLIGPPIEDDKIRSSHRFPSFREAMKEPEVLRYVIAYAGNTWEVFALRIWFVPFLAVNAGLNGEPVSGLVASLVAGISALIAVPVSIGVAELACGSGANK